MKRPILLLLAVVTIALAHAAAGSDSGPKREVLDSGRIVPKGLPFSEAVRIGELVFLSGQIGNVPGTMTLAEGGIAGETRQAMTNIRTVLEAHGLSTNDLVRCTVMMADMSEWKSFNEVYATFFSGSYPARSAFGTTGLALGARVEIECIASKSD